MILEQIVHRKRLQLQNMNLELIQPLKTDVPLAPGGFKDCLTGSGISVIAEIKQKSPSAGQIRTDFDPAIIARQYYDNGAAALSVLTEQYFFGGSNKFIKQAGLAAPLPILRKDFILSEFQIQQSKILGAEAVLLIVRILTKPQLKRFISLAKEFQLAALVEVHSFAELQTALFAGAEIIGINNRDLDSLDIDLQTSISF